MEKSQPTIIPLIPLGVACLAMLMSISCARKSDLPLPSSDKEAVKDQILYESYLYDADGLVDLAVNAQKDITGGRSQEAERPTDDRFSCAALTLTFSEAATKDEPIGKLLIDFSPSCADTKGMVRKGKISIEFKGKRFAEGSYVKYAFDNFSIEKVALEGERKMTMTQISKNNTTIIAEMSLTLNAGKAKWEDRTSMTLTTQRSRKWTHDLQNSNNDSWTIKGTAQGTMRNGQSFSTNIADYLLFDMKCIRGDIRMYLPTQGKMILTIGGDEPITCDFGQGNCDKQYTISKNGVTASAIGAN